MQRQRAGGERLQRLPRVKYCHGTRDLKISRKMHQGIGSDSTGKTKRCHEKGMIYVVSKDSEKNQVAIRHTIVTEMTYMCASIYLYMERHAEEDGMWHNVNDSH